MTISAKVFHKSRAARYCDECDKRIDYGTTYVRIYGAAEAGDRPYIIKICYKCAKDHAHYPVNAKIRQAIADYEDRYKEPSLP